jgi:hypothetical protein
MTLIAALYTQAFLAVPAQMETPSLKLIRLPVLLAHQFLLVVNQANLPFQMMRNFST